MSIAFSSLDVMARVAVLPSVAVGSEMRSVSITSPLSVSVPGCPLSQASRARTITAQVTMRNNAADLLLYSDNFDEPASLLL